MPTDGDGAADHAGALIEASQSVGTAAPQRVTQLGVALRRLRRAKGDDIAALAAATAKADATLRWLSPEALSAIERGDAPPPQRFASAVAAARDLGPKSRATLQEAEFLAADPLSGANGARAAASSRAAALRALSAPLAAAREPALDIEAAGRAVLNAPLTDLRRPKRPLVGRGSPHEQALYAAQRLRAAFADAEGRVPSDVLCDGFELALAPRIRIVFADETLSETLFAGMAPEIVALSGPLRAPAAKGAATESAAEPGDAKGSADLDPGAGYVALTAGAIAALLRGDAALRFGLLREIGMRLLGAEAGAYSRRLATEPALLATHRSAPRASAAPRDGLAGKGVAGDGVAGDRATGDLASGDAAARQALKLEGAANLFAFAVLCDPRRFSPAVERLDEWAAAQGVPFAAALRFHKDFPALFTGAAGAAEGAGSLWRRGAALAAFGGLGAAADRTKRR
ncbi:MAG: hypothetical protein AAGM38_03285 [Pseudomonadota bacterium]